MYAFVTRWMFFKLSLKFQLIRQLFVLSYEIEIQPAFWKYYETSSFKELMKVYDGMTK